MEKHFTFIGPGDTFMDERGRTFEKQADTYVPIQNKYVEAEERFVQKHLEGKVGNNE